MQATYKHIPGRVERIPRTVQERAHFNLTVLLNGMPVEFPERYDGKIIGETVDLVMSTRGIDMVNGKLYIGISRWGKYVTHYYRDQLLAAQQELPLLCKQLVSWFVPPPTTDLLTGLPVEPKFSVQYSFTDAKELTVHDDEVTCARVFFNTPLHPMERITASCSAGTLVFSPDANNMVTGSNLWTINRLGWIKVPNSLQWTPEQIKEAFQALAKEIVAAEPYEVETWKFKQVTRISLE